MIKNRTDYKKYLNIEVPDIQLFAGGGKEWLFPTPTRVFLKALRRVEYHYNCKGLWHKLMFLLAYRKYHLISLQTGIHIPKNTCEEGLTLYHFGSIVVNAACRIGRNCCIMNNVNIGANGGSNKAPQIGNNVYMGPGAVIYGDIEIADGCYIGANAVVNKSFKEPNSVIAGVPAKVIKTDSVNWWQNNRMKRRV